MVTNMKSSSSSKDISEPPKFSGNDGDWEGWYKLLKSYFKMKGWLEAFLHPIGPGNKDFPNPDFDIRKATAPVSWGSCCSLRSQSGRI
jgi:hypothetical protein